MEMEMDNETTSPTRRPFNTKVLLVIILLLIPATYAILPYTVSLNAETLEMVGWPLLLALNLINVAIYAAMAAVGLYLAAQIGLGLPFLESWLKKESVCSTFRKVLFFSVIVGVLAGLAIIALDIAVFGPPLETQMEELDITLPETAHPPPLYGALASFSAGITEEVIFRLFGVTLLAWLGSLIFKGKEGRPNPAVMWIAIVVIAVAFGLAHLPATVMIGIPLTGLVIVRAIVLNGVGGVAFGWLYWKRGLESAMIAHFSADIVLHVLLVIALSLL